MNPNADPHYQGAQHRMQKRTNQRYTRSKLHCCGGGDYVQKGHRKSNSSLLLLLFASNNNNDDNDDADLLHW
jgi:hypothetical protein